ncbi:MAG TPA: phosphonate C-P lyase system protein PhnH [Dongiaceae bacterium]|nr:phosphonate C-P lyase system protein PhnH [Dongiaceae bacterium]
MNQQTRIALQSLAPGFQDPQLDAQRVFRQLLQAMARPGQIVPIDRLPEAPMPLCGGAAALALTLFDLDTPIWLDDALRAAAGDYLAFHTGAPVTAKIDEAAFVLVADGRHLPDLGAMALGDPEYPERAATVIVQVERLRIEAGHRLRGPGILGHVDIAVDGLAPEFWTELRKNQKRFPLGFDAVLVAGEMVLALPRTVTLDAMEG